MKQSVAFALAASLALATPASADVIYTFTGTTAWPTGSSQTGSPPFNLSFDISDAAVARGSFQLSSTFIGGTLSGDVADLVSLTLLDDVVTPTQVNSKLQLSLTFNAAGDITSAFLNSFGVYSDVSLIESGGVVSGDFAADPLPCGIFLGIDCTFRGSLVRSTPAVPEPATLALLAGGLVTLAGVRRRR